MMRKIVMIRSHYPDIRAQKEAETLAGNRYMVTLIVWDRGRFSSSDKNLNYRIKKFRARAHPDSLKVAFYLPIWWLFVMLHLLIERWDVVHAADFDTFVPALFIVKIKRKRIVYDIFDFYADMIGFPILPSLLRKITAKIDRALMKFADVIILPDESRVEQIGINTRRKPVVIINNSPKEDIMSGITVKNFSDKEFVIFYGGGVTKERGIIDICSAVKDWHDVQLIIMGPCSPSFETELRQICKNISNVRLHLEWVPHEEVIAQTMSADLLFALYDPAIPNNRYASPNKLFEAMMCGKPIVVSDRSSMTDIVRRENCGIVVRYGDVAAIREAIIRLKSDHKLRQVLGEKGRRAYEERYSWSTMQKRLLHAYGEIAQSSKQRRKELPNQLRVCVVTFPFEEAFVTPLSNLVKVLHSFAGPISVITAGVGDATVTTGQGIKTYRIRQKRARNVFARIASYIYLQAKISFTLARVSRDTDVYVFFMEAGTLLPMLTARLARKKVVWALPSSLVQMVEHHKDPLSTLFVSLQVVAYNLSDRIVLYSENLIRKWHVEKHRDKVCIAHEHFLDFIKFRADRPLNERENLAGYVGRLSQEKGILNFLEAILEIVETRGDLTFLIGGDGALRPQVEQCVSKSNDKVKYVGWIPHDKLPKYLNQLKLFVLPSYTEGLPNIMLEAMACGTPVLATPVGAVPDVIKEGKTGFIMEDNSPECIARNVIRALNYPNLEEIAENARALVKSEFTYDKAVGIYREILNKLTSKS